MQKVMNMLFSMTGTGEICIPSMIDTAINDLLDFSADTYDALLYQMPEKQRIVSVSYTHLDVYKRQVYTGTRADKKKALKASDISSLVRETERSLQGGTLRCV